MSFYYSTLVLSNCLLIIACALGIFKRSVLKREKQCYLYYLNFILAIEIISQGLIVIFYVRNTGFIYPFYVAGEFFLLMSMFVTAQKFSRKWYIITGLIAAFIFIEAMALWFNNQDVTAGYGKVLSHLSIACFAGYSLIRGLKDFKKSNRFLLIYGCLLLYYAIAVFLFLLLPQLTGIDPQSASVVWGINNVLSSILYSASCYTFLRLKA